MPVHPVDLFAQGDLGSKLHSGARVDPEQVAVTCCTCLSPAKGTFTSVVFTGPNHTALD